jgi:hypothetical protein
MHAAVLVLALLDPSGFLSLRGINATGPQTWLDGGWGRLPAGGDENAVHLTAHAGIDWNPHRSVRVHASGVARQDAAGAGAGLIEAFVEARHEIALDEVRVRAGSFFLPTSRENRGELWSSPYSVSFSALNSWIGEEVRPLGIDAEYRHVTAAGHTIAGGATAFRGNDTMGALLAWRGWSSGNRLSVWNEVLPLPPLDSLDTFFAAQRDDGTKPFGRDLDGRTGLSARVRYTAPERLTLQYAYVDNRGDRALHRGEYAWATSFHVVGAEVGDPERAVVAAEWMTGSTGMGHAPAFADAGFYAAYLLVSARRDRHRLTSRYEIFATSEEDFSPAERNEESGRAWTFAWLYDWHEAVRFAVEFTQFVGERAGTPDPDARSVLVEARYRY